MGNKVYQWLMLAIIWFAGSIYALLVSIPNYALPFNHFDKICHLGLFFGQTWLIIKVYFSRHQLLPLTSLWWIMFCWAISSELIMLWLPVGHQIVTDILANLFGIIMALGLGWRIQTARLYNRSKST